eukprot:TRINITY_DN70240_c0_g1_i1.p1 TRINITY_DN70240_c0_g1~~TRINITY_DN70240_c0_g1_i1.p1  ORF type:complete len:382 (+),score=86.16 TRINITY_DN70240_c0_g1_i1:87-1148(+)
MLRGGRPALPLQRRVGSAARHGSSVAVASWNILTPGYCSAADYCHSLPEDCDPATRLKRVLGKLSAAMDSGYQVICLQEVGLSWAGPLHALFASRGFHFVHSGYGSQASDNFGVGVAWCTKSLRCRGVELRALADTASFSWPRQEQQSTSFLGWLSGLFFRRQPEFSPWAEAQRRRNLYCMAHLEQSDGTPFTVGCYHMPCLFGSAERVQTVNIHAALLAQRLHAAADGAPYLLVGDFNFQPGTSPYNLMTTGQLADSDPECPRGPEGFSLEVSPLSSAYAAATGVEPMWTCHAQQTRDAEPFTGTLDYILASPQWKVEEVMPLPAEPPSVKSHPTADEPSDHIMIGARLSLC